MQRLEVEDSDREDLLYQTESHQGGGESSINSRKNWGEGCWIYSILAFLAFILFVFLMIDIASSDGGKSDDDNGISDNGDAPYFVSSYGGVVATDDERFFGLILNSFKTKKVLTNGSGCAEQRGECSRCSYSSFVV